MRQIEIKPRKWLKLEGQLEAAIKAPIGMDGLSFPTTKDRKEKGIWNGKHILKRYYFWEPNGKSYTMNR